MRYIFALLAGLPVYLGLSPYGLWYVPFISVLVFALLWRQQLTAKQSFLLALAFHFGMFVTGVSWLYISIHIHGQVPAILAGVFTALFALFMAWMCALPWLISPLFRATNRLLAFPAVFLLGEWIRGWFFTGFPWLYLGQAHLETQLAGWMPVLGVLGGGLAVTCTACAILCIFTHRKPETVLVQSLLIMFIWGGGALLAKQEWTEPTAEPISAVLVQPNISLEDKWDKSLRQENISILISESAPYLDENQTEHLIIWPEAAIPYVGAKALEYLEVLDNQANAGNATLVTGYLTYDKEIRRFFNAIGAVGTGSGEYLKQRLVPFGEYVPLEKWLRGMMKFFDLPTSFITAGESDQRPLEFSQNQTQYVAAPAICYEIAYPSLVGRLANQAQMIITLSNDAWFGDSIGPWQHMEIAQTRALENQKPVLRVTNNGVTASVDHRGRITDQLPQFERGSLKTKITPMTGQTPFSRFRHVPVFSIALLVLVVAGWRTRKQISKQSS